MVTNVYINWRLMSSGEPTDVTTVMETEIDAAANFAGQGD